MCDGFRPGSQPGSYQLLSGGTYFNFSCQPPLVWSQEQCSCQAKPVVIEDPNCPHHRPYPGNPTKFQVRAHGVWIPEAVSCPPRQIWIQEKCWCDFDPSLNVTTEQPGNVTDILYVHTVCRLVRTSKLMTTG